MRKNFLLLMLMALLPLAAFADAGNLTGTIQDNLKGLKFTIIEVYNEVPDGKANIVSVAQNNWVEKAEDKTSLVIPSTVTYSVKGLDFLGNAIDKEVTFDVVKIDANGFADLGDLTSVTIPASVEEIGESAFAGDYALTTLQIATGSKLETIGAYAFSAWITGTFDLSSATSLEVLPNKLFLTATAEQNPYVTNVVLPASITDINTALAKLPNLATQNIAATKLASLENGALEGNTKITALELPATCLWVEDGALKSTKVEDLTINANQAGTTQTIGQGTNSIYGTVAADLTVLKALHIVGEFKGTIAANAFKGLGELASIDMDDISGTITNDAFTGNAKLATIELGNIKDGAEIQAAFASTLAAGAELTIGNIGKATIAGGAFAGLKSVEIGNIATTTAIGNAAFAGEKLATITIGNITGNVGAAFDSNLAAGAEVTIASIGADATFAANFVDNAKSIIITNGIACTTAIADNAFAGSKLATINIGAITGKVGASFTSTLGTGAALTIASIGTGANLASGAFGGIKSLAITNGISAGTIAAGSFVFIANGGTANLGNISGGTFTADAITGTTTDGKKVTLTIGNVSAALANNLLTGNIDVATVGEITAAVSVEALGKAAKMVFGAVKTDGSITGASTANTTLTEVNFVAVEVEAGITATSFTNCTKLATVKFNGLLADNAVAASAFKTAGSAADAVSGTRMTVTYLPETLTKPFAQATFGSAAGTEVKLKTTQAFFENYEVAEDYFYRVVVSYTKAPITKTIKFEGEVAPDGYKYARFYVNNDESAVFAKDNGVTAYSVYVDGVDIYMNPLRVYNSKYEINGVGGEEIRAAIIVKSKSGEDITVTMNPETPLTKQSIQNANDKFGLLYNDLGVALTGAKISMENTNFFKLSDHAGTAVNWATLQTDANYAHNNAIVLVSNPKSSKYIKFADFDPTSQPTVKIADKGYYLLTAKAAAGAPRQVIWLDDMGNTTAIDTVEKATEASYGNNAIYNIAGQKVSTDYKGLVIKNGKKYIQK